MNYTEEFENMSYNTYRTKPKPIEEFNYASMKCFGSMKYFMNKCDENINKIHECVSKYNEKDFRWEPYYKNNINFSLDVPHIFNMLSELYIDIKTYWNMMGSLILPIRNHLPSLSKFYSSFKDNLNIFVLNKMKFGRYNFDESNEVTKVEFGDGYRTFVEGMGTILHCVQKVSILEDIKDDKKDNVTWSFETYMKSSISALSNADFDGELKNYMFLDAFNLIIEEITNDKEMTNEKIKLLNEFDIKTIVVGIINILIYKSYEYMTVRYIEEFDHVSEIFKSTTNEKVKKYLPFKENNE